MNVLLINTAYSGGGAEKVTRQMLEGINAFGNKSIEVANYSKIPVPDNVRLLYNTIPLRIFNRIITFNHCNISYHMKYSISTICKIIRNEKIDIVHIHNLHGNYFGIGDISQIVKLCPIVWTLHDMWTFTGNCFYVGACSKYKDNCLKCPSLDTSTPFYKYLYQNYFEKKKRAIINNEIYFVSPSEWLARKARSSWLKNEKISVINNGVNLKSFKANSKVEIRNKYNLPSNKRYIAFVTAKVTDPRKGFNYLINALDDLSNKEEYIVLAVGDVDELKKIDIGIQTVYFGYVHDESKLNEIYSMADIFVLPSLEDNFPCVTLEALASGTPVISFDTGGIPEQINQNTGWIVSDKNAKKLKDSIENAFKDPKRLKEMSLAARSECELKFSEDLMVDKYMLLYADILR
jgi:putative colanic acid biosynthesis glycosyltransferase